MYNIFLIGHPVTHENDLGFYGNPSKLVIQNGILVYNFGKRASECNQ
jgi:hypothetical protein